MKNIEHEIQHIEVRGGRRANCDIQNSGFNNRYFAHRNPQLEIPIILSTLTPAVIPSEEGIQ